MCGIAGIVAFDRPGSAQVDRLRPIVRRLRHRGPDGEGLVARSFAALGSRRLAVVDAAGGAQPYSTSDGRFTLVYNGELIHASRLRERLQRRLADRPGGSAFRFRSRCDTEVVLAAWLAWGPRCLEADCPEQLDGMFAFFVWDEKEQRGYGARDPLGIKPLVHRIGRDPEGRPHLVFASEAKALLDELPGRPAAARLPLVEYLAAPCFSGVERPLFEGLDYLPPGHLLEIDRQGHSIRPYARFRFDPEPGAAADGLARELRAALGESVEGSLDADRPIGVFLSGGLDSTALAALARPSQGRPSFAIRFQGRERFDHGASRIVVADDVPFAELAARELGTDHTFVDIADVELEASVRRLAVQNCALPAWEQEIAQDRLAAAASRQVKAVLVGDAADELHWGYHFLLDAEATRSPSALLRRFAKAPLRAELTEGDASSWLDRHYRALVARHGHDWSDPEARQLATGTLIVERWLPRLLHNGDIHTMAHGLEARVPFASRRSIALAQRIPPALARQKSLLRRALRGVVPEAIRGRRKSALPKAPAPDAVYRRALAPRLDGAEPWLDRLLDPGEIRTLVQAKNPLDESERALLFRLLALITWAEEYSVEMP